jgi:hypothetical protein
VSFLDLSDFCLCLLRDVIVLTFARLNHALESDMKFQDEGGLLLPPSIEQKISSTGISTMTNPNGE